MKKTKKIKTKLIVSIFYVVAIISIVYNIIYTVNTAISSKEYFYLFRISLFGTIVSLGLIMLPYIFKKQITEITYPSQYVNLFISCVSGSALCYYYFFGFLICLILSIIAKFAKRERKF